MADITATMVRQLREETGLGMMDCKKALEETAGDFEAAKDILRKKGLASAEKKAGRATSEGLTGIKSSNDRTSATMVEVRCETDFCARNDEFRDLAKDIAMHTAAMNPKFIKPEDVHQELVAKEKEIWAAQLANEGKPAEMLEKIMVGKEKKFREESALLTQPFVKNPEITVGELIVEKIGKIGENIQVGEIVRIEL